MKKLKFVLAFSLMIALNACTQQNESSNTEKSTTDSTSNAKASYQCPMKCEGEKCYEKGGKCPECKMDLAKSK